MTEAMVVPESGQSTLPTDGSRPEQAAHKATPRVTRLRNLLGFRSISYRRLENALPILREELAFLSSLRCPKLPLRQRGWAITKQRRSGESMRHFLIRPVDECGHGEWRARSDALLKAAEQALENGDAEQGWSYFKGASRYLLYGMEECRPELLRSRAHGLRREAEEKLHGWRLETVLDLLTEPDRQTLKSSLPVDNVVRAAQILDEHHDNTYQKLIILRKQLRNLTIAMGIVALAWIVIASSAHDTAIDTRLLAIAPGTATFWIAVPLLGMMGAILSAFLSITAKPREARIPVNLADNWVIFARLGLAALTAIMASLLLYSGIINFGIESRNLIWGVALMAGFSERLVVRALGNAQNIQRR